MDKNKLIQQGEEAKFLVNIKNFDMHTDRFFIELMYSYRNTTIKLTKEDMEETAEGWIMTFQTDNIVGRVTARCTWDVGDLDCKDLYRTKVDEQILCFVVPVPCPQFIACGSCGEEEHQVTYTHTDQSDIGGKYDRLVDVNEVPITTADNEYIYVLHEN